MAKIHISLSSSKACFVKELKDYFNVNKMLLESVAIDKYVIKMDHYLVVN